MGVRDFKVSTNIKCLEDIIEKQLKVEDSIKDRMDKITEIDDPVVILDPYGCSPLSFLIIFKTKKLSKVSIIIKDKYKDSKNIIFNFDEYNREHIIPMYGIYLNYKNKIIVKIEDDMENRIEKNIEVTVKGDYKKYKLSKNRVLVNKKDINNKDLFFVGGLDHSPFAIDNNGEIRWINTLEANTRVCFLKNGNILLIESKESRLGGTTRLFEVDLLGKIYGVYYIPSGVHHDICQIPNGNVMFLTNDYKGEFLTSSVGELDLSKGNVVRRFDVFRLLDFDTLNNRYYGDIENPIGLDAHHLNGIVYDDTDNSLIISARKHSIIFKVDYNSLDLVWILGNPEKYNEEYKKKSFRVIGEENFKWFLGQHSPNIISDNNGILNLLVFDNNTNEKYTNKKSEFRYSRLVKYEVDVENMTIKELDEFGKGYDEENIFTINRGSSWYDKNNNTILGYFISREKDINRNLYPRGREDINRNLYPRSREDREDREYREGLCGEVSRIIEVSEENMGEVLLDIKLLFNSNRTFLVTKSSFKKINSYFIHKICKYYDGYRDNEIYEYDINSKTKKECPFNFIGKKDIDISISGKDRCMLSCKINGKIKTKEIDGINSFYTEGKIVFKSIKDRKEYYIKMDKMKHNIENPKEKKEFYRFFVKDVSLENLKKGEYRVFFKFENKNHAARINTEYLFKKY